MSRAMLALAAILGFAHMIEPVERAALELETAIVAGLEGRP